MSSRKRMRSMSARRGALGALTKGGKYPYSTHGTLHVRRGSSDAMYVGLTPGAYAHQVSPQEQMMRKNLGWTGRGSYKRIGGRIGSAIGRAAGNKTLGYALGRVAGSGADVLQRMYQGRGAYVSNQLMVDGSAMKQGMQVTGTRNETDDVVFTHREYIQDVYAPKDGLLENREYSINPGLQSTFPWLSQIAANYEEYELIQCIFYYRSTVSESTSNTNGQAGSVFLVTNYNPTAPKFTDKETMMQYHGAVSGKITEDLVHGVECHPSKLTDTCKYVRTGPVSDDIKDYDHAKFQLGIQNTPAAFIGQIIGELWVDYKVRLSKPKFYTNRGLGIQKDIFVDVSPTQETYFSAANTIAAKRNNIGCSLIPGTTGSNGFVDIVLPPTFAGRVKLEFTIEASDGTAPTFSGSAPLSFSFGINSRISSVLGLHAVQGGSTDAPLSAMQLWRNENNIQCFMLQAILDVLPAGPGNDNVIRIGGALANDSWNAGDGALGSAKIEITEEPNFSYSTVDSRFEFLNNQGGALLLS